MSARPCGCASAYLHEPGCTRGLAGLQLGEPMPAITMTDAVRIDLDRVNLDVLEVGPAAFHPSALLAAVERLAALMDPGGRYVCRVEGCGWALDVPHPQLVQDGGPLQVYGVPMRLNSVIRWEGVKRTEVLTRIAAHVEDHAGNGVPAVVDPPDWGEQEWCDGSTCEHPACLARLVEP